MQKLIWIFIIINWAASFLFLFSGITFGLPKDANTKLYLFGLVIILFLFGFLGWYFRFSHPYWAMAIAGFPAITFILVTLFYKY